jgi:TonB family protein
MKITLSLIVIIISNNVFGQIAQHTIVDRNNNIIENYYASKEDTLLKEGRYSAYTYFTKGIICRGFYKNNLKDSVWSYYSLSGILIDSGYYHQDKKVGIWRSYKNDGQLQMEYDFTNKKLISNNPDPQDADTTNLYKVVNKTDFKMSVLDQPPVYIDGDAMLKTIIMINLRYPQQARQSETQGTVVVGFIVNEDGHVSDYKIIRPAGHGLDEAALDAVKHVTGDWLPGVLNGKPVAVEHMIPIGFSLPQ